MDQRKYKLIIFTVLVTFAIALLVCILLINSSTSPSYFKTTDNSISYAISYPAAENKAETIFDSTSYPVSYSGNQDELVTLREDESGLEFNVPKSLYIDGFENANPDSFIINWKRNIYLGGNEIMGLAVWSRNSSEEIQKVYDQIVEMNPCGELNKKLECVIELNQEGFNNVYYKYIIINNVLIGIEYSYKKFNGIKDFLNIALTIQINGEYLIKEEGLDLILNKAK